LELALQTDDTRLWTGAWRGDFQGVLEDAKRRGNDGERQPCENGDSQWKTDGVHEIEMDSEEESEPPEFDLRTGRYISHTRPMQHTRSSTIQSQPASGTDSPQASTALSKRAKGDMTVASGIASPAAEYLAQKRTWRGLGSDFEVRYEVEDGNGEVGSIIEEGRTGVARGYTVGESSRT